RAYRVSVAAGRTVGDVEEQIGRRAVIERIVRGGDDLPVSAKIRLEPGDEVLLAGPSAEIVAAARTVGREIEGQDLLGSSTGQVLQVYVTAARLHGRSL